MRIGLRPWRIATLSWAVALAPTALPLGDDNGVSLLENPLELERRLVGLVERSAPATVALQVGGSAGSGVIVSADGLVLTAGHVIGRPGRELSVLFPDGRRMQGVSLGLNSRRDTGMVRINDAEGLPFCPVAPSGEHERGDWCVTLGHPGGFDDERAIVARIGRILDPDARFMHTDCPIISGDSGGPLFDLQGRVIGIHSRIQSEVSSNFHVPIDAYHSQWTHLVNGENLQGGNAKLGLWRATDVDGGGLRIDRVFPDRPAAKAGLEEGDALQRFGGYAVADLDELKELLADRRADDLVELEVKRGDEVLLLWAVLAGPRTSDPESNR